MGWGSGVFFSWTFAAVNHRAVSNLPSRGTKGPPAGPRHSPRVPGAPCLVTHDSGRLSRMCMGLEREKAASLHLERTLIHSCIHLANIY